MICEKMNGLEMCQSCLGYLYKNDMLTVFFFKNVTRQVNNAQKLGLVIQKNQCASELRFSILQQTKH